MEMRLPLDSFHLINSFDPLFKYGVFNEHELVPFEHECSAWSSNNAWYMAECSRLAYSNDPNFKNEQLAKVGMTNAKHWDVEGTQVFVTWNAEMVWLVCTGTELQEGTKDILVDLQAWPVNYQNGDCWVHSGFQRAINYVLEDVIRFVNNLLDERRELWITGHSLGGALALIFSTYFENNGTYTFGCPRVFSKGAKKLFKGPIYRIEEPHDIVTRIPLPPVFKHFGEQMFITHADCVEQNPSFFTREYIRFGGNELTVLWNLVKILLLKGAIRTILKYLHGHSPYNYSVYMWNNIARKHYVGT